MIIQPYANDSARIVEPDKAPIPTFNDICASSVGFPKPENKTIIPSGTPPKNGSIIEPISGAYGVSSNNSLPSPIYFDDTNKI